MIDLLFVIFHCDVIMTVNIFDIFFFFNDTATTEIYTLSLHDALPISQAMQRGGSAMLLLEMPGHRFRHRSEEHTSELQSQSNLVCRLLLEKKKNNNNLNTYILTTLITLLLTTLTHTLHTQYYYTVSTF